MINCGYVDTQDRSRKLVPVKDAGSHWECRVFWKGKGYGGMTLLSKKLFTDNEASRVGQYGFVLLGKK